MPSVRGWLPAGKPLPLVGLLALVGGIWVNALRWLAVWLGAGRQPQWVLSEGRALTASAIPALHPGGSLLKAV